MKESDRYLKIVEWSEEDGCYVGRSPGLFFGGVHGPDELDVYRELCVVVDEWVEVFKRDGLPLPEPTVGREYSGKFVLRMDPQLHRLLAIRSLREGESLNTFCVRVLGEAVGLPPGVAVAGSPAAADRQKKAGVSVAQVQRAKGADRGLRSTRGSPGARRPRR